MAPARTQTEPATLEIPDFEAFPDLYGWPRENSSGYRIKEQLCGTERPLRIISLGAGVSGINLAKILPERVNNISLTIYEKDPEVGGTWFENRYPGVACDIPSNNYQFTWAKNPHWKHFYSYGDEIHKYLTDVVDRFGLRKYFVLNHEVMAAEWSDSDGVWVVKVRNLTTGEVFVDRGEIFINNGGLLNNWRWPEIEGLEEFEGPKCHTAQWDDSIDYRGKRVAVIGTGSSGVQVIPHIAPDVAQLYTWVRSPTWITAGFAQKYAGPGGTNFEYPEEQKQYWAENPLEYQDYCKNIESELNQRFKFILNGSPAAEEAKKFSVQQMKEKLGSRTDVAAKLIPTSFGVGCRRPTPGNGFLESLGRPNVQVFTEVPRRITRTGFVDHEGNEHQIDVLICATGFDTSWIPRFPILAHGKNVQDLHREKLLSYLSIAVPDIPNYFTICGPYGPFGHGSYIAMSELLVRNITAITKKMQKENIKSITPRREVCEKFAEHADLYVQRTAWSGPCSSWFKNGQKDGRLTMWPGSRLVYFDVMAEPRFEDYRINYWSGNPFGFLGNGYCFCEIA
ncbi:steroid monooxygenase [Aspergillus pseudoustus]|uniref:Steroid monooxygenase n=1 Tax=Aspergillus pseudoustus TaxID=1810923 RepID=A0ABR4ITN2_9EURO